VRTSQDLRRIASVASALREARGDTEWSEQQRAAVAAAREVLDDLLDGPMSRQVQQPDSLAARLAGPGSLEQPHPCEHRGCPHTVAYDDEPWCFEHSPNEGSYVPGYSWSGRHLAEEVLGED
jgi:hypothetical protein